MKLVIVSGHSGSGKSVALHTLEDLGYYCIDNLPAGLLSAFALELKLAPNPVETAAVGIDARNLPQALQQFNDILEQLKIQGVEPEIVFLTCDTDTLIKRFSETRRRHPLSNDQVSLAEAVELEKTLLEPIARRADLFIDTSKTTIHQLRGWLLQRVDRRQENRLSLSFQSFGYKHGVPHHADFVFDARCLPNPYWLPDLRPLTGCDPDVINYLKGENLVKKMFQELCNFLDHWIPAFEKDNRSYMTIAIGCTGGQHRSVYLAERLAHYFEDRYPSVTIRHRELS